MFIELLPGTCKSVRYKVLPFVIDHKLARTDSKSGRHSSSWSVVVLLYGER